MFMIRWPFLQKKCGGLSLQATVYRDGGKLKAPEGSEAQRMVIENQLFFWIDIKI